MQDQDVNAYCRELYDRTRTLWRSLEGRYPTWECRFSILYGPPRSKPDLLVLGANPGYNPADLYDEEIQTWPAANEYVTRDWPLARRLRSLFADAGCLDHLQASLGTNVLFFKSKSLGRHASGLGWADNPPDVRVRLEEHCRRELGELIRVLQPKTILTLGLSVFDGFTDGDACAVSGESGRRVAAIGSAHDVKTLGIIHPTGAQVSIADWGIVASNLAGELKGDMTTRRSAVAALPKLLTPPSPAKTMGALLSESSSLQRQRPSRSTSFSVILAGDATGAKEMAMTDLHPKLIEALELVQSGAVTFRSGSNGATLAGSGQRLKHWTCKAFYELKLIEPSNEAVDGSPLVLTELGRSALAAAHSKG